MVLIPASFPDDRQDPISPNRLKLLLILETMCRNKAYCWFGNEELAARYGCCVRRMQVLLREAEEDADIQRVMPEFDKKGRVGIVLRRRLVPGLPAADTPESLELAMARLKEHRECDQEQGRAALETAPSERCFQRSGRALFPAPEEERTLNEDEVEEKTSTWDDDEGGLPGETGERTGSGAAPLPDRGAPGAKSPTPPPAATPAAGPVEDRGRRPPTAPDAHRRHQAEEFRRKIKIAGFQLELRAGRQLGALLMPGFGGEAKVPDYFLPELLELREDLILLLEEGSGTNHGSTRAAPAGGPVFPPTRIGAAPKVPIKAKRMVHDTIGRLRSDPDPELVEWYASDLVQLFGDYNEESYATFKRHAEDVRMGRVPEAWLHDAFDEACKPQKKNRGAAYIAAYKEALRRYGKSRADTLT